MRTYFKYILSSMFSKISKSGLPRGAKRSGGFTHTPKSLVSGFTLTELIVVISIATAIMTTLVIQQNKWSDSLAVSTQAYDLALMIRQAQIYSLGVRENTAGVGDKFGGGYGVYFDSGDPASKTRYIFFADVNHNGEYDTGVDQIIENRNLTKGVIIDRFCGIKGTGNEQERCSPGTGNVSFMHITFYRPEAKARIIMKNSGGGPAQNVIPPAEIHLKSPNDVYFNVIVEENGQISTSIDTP